MFRQDITVSLIEEKIQQKATFVARDRCTLNLIIHSLHLNQDTCCWDVDLYCREEKKKKQLTVFKPSQIGPLYHIFILITYLLIYCTLKLPQLFVVSTDTPAHTLAV